MQSQYCYDVEGINSYNTKCLPNDPTRSNNWWHRTQLTVHPQVKPAKSDKVYITECLDYANANNDPKVICTTGSHELDKELMCGDANATAPECDNLKIMEETLGYRIRSVENDPVPENNFMGEHLIGDDYGIFFFEGGNFVKKNNPQTISADSSGNITPKIIEWQSYTPAIYSRKFLLWHELDTSDPDPNPEGLAGQQQADLSLLFSSSLCEGQVWDPYGVVFDADTLEPVSGVNVSLLQKNQSGVFTQEYATAQNSSPFTLLNPYTTQNDGWYSFFVVDGDYKLVPNKTNYLHLTKADSSTIASGYDQLYSDIYYPDEVTTQVGGKPEHRDIPVRKQAEQVAGARSDLAQVNNADDGISILSQTKQLDSNGSLHYSGRVSSPLALVKVEKCKVNGMQSVCNPFKEIDKKTGGPDVRGEFSFSLPGGAKNLAIGEYYRITFEKQNLVEVLKLSKLNIIQKTLFGLIDKAFGMNTVFADDSQTVSVNLQPMPRYIEGYAYGQNGLLMSNATVGIYVPYMTRAIYQTKTDTNGFYRIATEYLPETEYTIQYMAEVAGVRRTVRLQTSQVLGQNKEFIASEKINIDGKVTSKTNPRRDVTPSFIPKQQISSVLAQSGEDVLNQTASVAVPTDQDASQNRNPMFLIGAILLILVGGAGVILAIYVYKKRSMNEE